MFLCPRIAGDLPKSASTKITGYPKYKYNLSEGGKVRLKWNTRNSSCRWQEPLYTIVTPLHDKM